MMNHPGSFTFKLLIEDTYYEGTVIPSRDIERNGFPVYFRIMIGNIFLANLQLGKSGWARKDGIKEGKNKLIQRIGEYIESRFA
jgi:hypothetical protein